MAVYLQDACIPAGWLYTCRMAVYLQDGCIPVGCLYTCRMSVYLQAQSPTQLRSEILNYFFFWGGSARPDPPFKSAWRPPGLIVHIPADTVSILNAYLRHSIRYNKYIKLCPSPIYIYIHTYIHTYIHSYIHTL